MYYPYAPFLPEELPRWTVQFSLGELTPLRLRKTCREAQSDAIAEDMGSYSKAIVVREKDGFRAYRCAGTRAKMTRVFGARLRAKAPKK